MTAQELQRLAQKLSNQCFVRYWTHYNYPESPPVMAIAAIDFIHIKALDQQLLEKGFQRVEDKDFDMWTIERTDWEQAA